MPGICLLCTDRGLSFLLQEEVNNLKKEGNLEELFGKLDTLEEEAKDREMPAW